jgi:hypothetical protein
MEITSHSVVRASYSAARGFPFIRKVDFSLTIGVGSLYGEVGAAMITSPPTAVSTMPDPAACRKFLRE